MNVSGVLLTEDGLQIRVDGETQDGAALLTPGPHRKRVPAENVYLAGLALGWAEENAQRVKAEYTNWSVTHQLRMMEAGKKAAPAKLAVQASDQYQEHKGRIALADRIKISCAALQSAVKRAVEIGA